MWGDDSLINIASEFNRVISVLRGAWPLQTNDDKYTSVDVQAEEVISWVVVINQDK